MREDETDRSDGKKCVKIKKKGRGKKCSLPMVAGRELVGLGARKAPQVK